MKYLNRIVFINSADKSIKYAEVSLDGNVHFIGTQGVGKSTLLRAILFFYNADKTKLGIPREKKNFDEYYFPFQNSYIIYEVQTENALFCVLAFKSQGRTAFRFINSAYDISHFVTGEGQVYESWDKTREALGKNIYYTKIIHSYEEYRNILYGNNKGLPNEFKKYAILESKQYQNIPRTITNVFLNANLSAEFVKETIIKSFNEDDVKIDLTTYSQNHLRDFETSLNDIKKWTDKNRNGENPVEKQAEQVLTYYLAIKHLEKHKQELAYHLGWAVNYVAEKQPIEIENLRIAELKRNKLKVKIGELNSAFEKKREKVQEQIGVSKHKLDDVKKKRNEYAALKIERILQRVAQKAVLALEKRNLTEENEVLTSRFLEIQQRFEALLKQLANQLHEFSNGRQSEKNKVKEAFLYFKEETNKQYDLLFDEIRKQHEKELELARELVEDKAAAITNLKIKRSEIQNSRFYDAETEKCNAGLQHHRSIVANAGTEIQRTGEKIQNIRKEWELEEMAVKAMLSRKIEKQVELQQELSGRISAIDSRLENSKDSLYGWLNEQLPGWDQNIGKVIDEEAVLFKPGLNPKLISNTDFSFYGISLDLNEIDKKVKTLADYKQEKEDLNNQLQSLQLFIAELNANSSDELDKLKRKFQPRIKEQKEIIHNHEYARGQSNIKLDELEVRLMEWKRKAEAEKRQALAQADDDLAKLNEEQIVARNGVNTIEQRIIKQLEGKKKEKEIKIKAAQQKLADTAANIDLEIDAARKEIAQREAVIKANQKKELDNQGADTSRITEIDLRLSEINAELTFIENNTSLVAEYNKDRRELFDKEDEFKSEKALLEKQLETEKLKQKQQHDKFLQEMRLLDAEINTTKEVLDAFQKDVKAFDEFRKSEIYPTVENKIAKYANVHQTELRAWDVIEELKKNHYQAIDRLGDLQEVVNKFTGNFQENNVFSFKTKFADRAEYIQFAELLKEFIEEDKISEYKKRVEERFAHIIRQIGKETGELISREGEIHGVIRDINKDFVARNFVGAVKSMELRTVPSANKIFQLLIEIKKFNDENTYTIGKPNLFSTDSQVNKNEKAISLLKRLIKEMATYKEKEISLSDSFELQFRIVENDNDTDWVEKLTNVGSEGTDILVKAMINIMLLNVFKDRAAKKHKGDFWLHCMLDEIGKLHPNNVKGILKFANDRNIFLINGSPTSYNATDYRYTYLLAKDFKSVTNVKRLVRKIAKPESAAEIQ